MNRDDLIERACKAYTDTLARLGHSNKHPPSHRQAMDAAIAAIQPVPEMPTGWRDHGDQALAHISNALDDLQYSPDQRPVPLLNEAMHHIRAMVGDLPGGPTG